MTSQLHSAATWLPLLILSPIIAAVTIALLHWGCLAVEKITEVRA